MDVGLKLIRKRREFISGGLTISLLPHGERCAVNSRHPRMCVFWIVTIVHVGRHIFIDLYMTSSVPLTNVSAAFFTEPKPLPSY